MPNVSSTNLFNYTDSYVHLIDNLTNGIYCGYHEERLYTRVRFRIPMTCFCDIPLNLIKEHFKWYGRFGIGIDKRYAYEVGVKPVWYLTSNNPLLRTFSMRNTHQLSNVEKNMLKLSKQYSGQQEDIDGIPRRKKLYDEKEWRYVPSNSSLHINGDIDAVLPGPVPYRFPLSHTLEEVLYIIIPDEAQIPTLITDLHTLAAHRGINPNLMISRIQIARNIIRDF
jgi:hypothetical protein